MALVSIARVWTFSNNGSFTTASWSGLDFDTDTHTVVPSSGGYNLALLDPRPQNYTASFDTLLWFECAPDFTKTNYFYNGGTSIRTETIANSTECGWVPIVIPPTCDLVLTATVAGDVITASAAGAHGALTYSIDGGASRQASGVFAANAPGSYVVTAYDAGASNCTRSVTVAVVASSPGLTPVAGALPDVAFAGNPIALVGQATRPGRALLLELFIESSHGSRQYRRIVQRLRPTDNTGRTVLELQKQLAAALTPDRPQLSRANGLRRLTGGIRRYYAALAEIQPGTGLPGPYVFEAPRTVLLGGLSWAAARAGSFFAPVPAQFLTWRPNVVQEVGEMHILLQTALLPADTPSCYAQVSVYRKGETAAFQVQQYPLTLLAADFITSGELGSEAAEGTGRLQDAAGLNPPTPFLVELQVAVSTLPRDAYRVSVRLFDAQDVPRSELRVFRIARTERRRQFVFRNSLGCFEALSCSGPRSSKVTVERTVATTLPPPDYDPQEGPSRVASVATDERISVSTGLVAPEELHWLRELHTSSDVYEVIGGQLCKILLTAKDLVNYQDDGGADGYAFEYQYAYDPTPYAPYAWI